MPTLLSPLLLSLFGLFCRRRVEELPRGAAFVPLPAAQAQARQPRSGAGGGHRREAFDALRTGTAAKEKGTNDKKV